MMALEKPGIMDMTCSQKVQQCQCASLPEPSLPHLAYRLHLHDVSIRTHTNLSRTSPSPLSSGAPHLAHGPHLHDVLELLVHDAQSELPLADLLKQLLLGVLLQGGVSQRARGLVIKHGDQVTWATNQTVSTACLARVTRNSRVAGSHSLRWFNCHCLAVLLTLNCALDNHPPST